VIEKQAITRLKRGDLGGLEALVELYQLQAVRAACLIVSDRRLAEDIVQSAFIRAGERIEQFDDRRSFGPWFLRSVVYDAIKAAKRQKRQVPLDDEGGEETLDLLDPAPLPEERAESEETRQVVWRALEHLPPQQRAAIIMRYYLDMSEAEMAARLHSPTGTIKWWLHAARQRLKRLLPRPWRAAPIPAFKSRLLSESDRESGDKA
jgi:RNA polymerase sigma-70 factor (ECF subfamily)